MSIFTVTVGAGTPVRFDDPPFDLEFVKEVTAAAAETLTQLEQISIHDQHGVIFYGSSDEVLARNYLGVF